jgi:hypothetical protein
MIDDDIKDALNVDPSPEFVARVRARVANEPEPSAWRWSWTVAATAALAAAIIVAIVLRPAPQPQVAQGLSPAEAAASDNAAPDVAQAVPLAAPATASPVGRAFGPATPAAEAFARRASSEPEILLDPAETRALRALIAGVRDGRVDLTPLQAAAVPTAMELEPVADIVIAPITLEPIAPLSGAEGARP